jgi:hypothetical protein
VQQSISIGTGTVECFGGDVAIGGHGGHGGHSGDRCLSSCSTDFDGRTGGDENSPKILEVTRDVGGASLKYETGSGRKRVPLLRNLLVICRFFALS